MFPLVCVLWNRIWQTSKCIAEMESEVVYSPQINPFVSPAVILSSLKMLPKLRRDACKGRNIWRGGGNRVVNAEHRLFLFEFFQRRSSLLTARHWSSEKILPLLHTNIPHILLINYIFCLSCWNVSILHALIKSLLSCNHIAELWQAVSHFPATPWSVGGWHQRWTAVKRKVWIGHWGHMLFVCVLSLKGRIIVDSCLCMKHLW